MNYGMILAGGTGSRFGANMPKQFLFLGEKPIIAYTIEKFLTHEGIDRVIICCIDEWREHLQIILNNYFGEYRDKLCIVCGGNDRTDSILNGCNYIKENFGLTKFDIVITHDAVRPFVSHRIITDNIDAAQSSAGVDTVVPAIDTIVKSVDGNNLDDIPYRGELFYGQTPQTFNLIKLMDCYQKLSSDDKKKLTDACKVMLLNGENVGIVNGDYSNIKITNIYDLKLANSILEVGEENEKCKV